MSADPVKAGVVQQLASPGGNVTGVAIHAHVIGKRLELLRAMVPHARRILVTPNPDLEDTKAWIEELRDASRRLNVTIVELPITTKTDLERWPETFRNERIDAVFHLVNATVNDNWEVALRALQAARMPDMSYYLPAVENHWVLAAYAIPHREAWRMSARFVARILRGAKPQDLPVESPDVLELHINRRIAKERGIQIPEAILRRADKTFE